jgi:hypothetical protein
MIEPPGHHDSDISTLPLLGHDKESGRLPLFLSTKSRHPPPRSLFAKMTTFAARFLFFFSLTWLSFEVIARAFPARNPSQFIMPGEAEPLQKIVWPILAATPRICHNPSR